MHENNVEKIKASFEDNKALWIVGILVVVGVAIALIAGSTGKDEELVVEGCRPGFAFNMTTGEACPAEIANAYPEGCKPGFKFSETSGVPCEKDKAISCSEGNIYDINTGQLCPK